MSGTADLLGHRILLVEPQAHLEHGHYPLTFAERAADLIELGYDVEALTSQGWTLADDPTFPTLTIHRFGRVARGARWVTRRLVHISPRKFRRRLHPTLTSAVVVLAARVRRRKIGATAVVMFPPCDERVASLLAGPGRWLLHECGPPHLLRGASGRVLGWGARQAELRRERRGGRMRVSYPTDATGEPGRRKVSWLRPQVVPFATVRERRETAAADARAELGLPERARLALVFGIHSAKDLDVALGAFARLPEWQLVVAGKGAASAYRRWEAHGRVDASPILVDGFVDEGTRALLHSAVNLVVLSYQRSWTKHDSGGLADAIGWGLPVVCSDGCWAAHITRARGLGVVFEPGNVDALVEAVRAAPTSPDTSGLAQARSELSGPRAARQLLDALFL